jgi:hypothetical protein
LKLDILRESARGSRKRERESSRGSSRDSVLLGCACWSQLSFVVKISDLR